MSGLDIFKHIKGLFDLKARKVYIDNIGFRFHYKVTSVLLAACGIFVTSKQYFGDPISCISTDSLIKDIINTYCWIHGTFTHRISDDPTAVIVNGRNVPFSSLPSEYREFPGIIKEKTADRDYAKYYQWVWIVLFIQAACFYLPHWIWKTLEGERLKTLVGVLNSHVLADEAKSKQLDIITKYFKQGGRGSGHSVYLLKRILCEVLYCLNVIIQFMITERFVGNRFWSYGLSFFQDNSKLIADQKMAKVFPTVTYCVIPVCGLTCENPVLREGFCVLPINILNQKIYMVLWFWFIFLAVLSAICLLYRVVSLLPGIRKWRLRSCSKTVVDDEILNTIMRMDYADTFFLTELGKNINPVYFTELLERLGEIMPRRNSDLDSNSNGKMPLLA